MNNHRETVIRKYIDAYNSFDIESMCEDLHDEILFVHISGGKTSMKLKGIASFRQQAEVATTYFSERTQSIQSIRWDGTKATVAITYQAIVAKDLPNGLQKGQKLALQGKSVFHFEEDTIVKIQDLS